jgi:hypothetical protein
MSALRELLDGLDGQAGLAKAISFGAVSVCLDAYQTCGCEVKGSHGGAADGGGLGGGGQRAEGLWHGS